MEKIVVVGSMNVDIAMRATKIPRPGETVRADEITIGPGGKGLNQAIAAANLGGVVCMIGRVGDDAFAQIPRDALASAGVDTRYVEEEAGGHTGVASIVVDQDDGQNAIAVAGGANHALSVAQLEGAASAFEGARVLLVQLEAPLETIFAALDLARSRGMTTILDPAPARELPPELLAKVDFLTPNETEASLLAGIAVADVESAGEAGLRLQERTGGVVVVTLGAKGCVWTSPEGAGHIPAREIRALDTTGAGDAFNGALAYCLSDGVSQKQALEFAIRAGSASTLVRGAAESMPTPGDLLGH